MFLTRNLVVRELIHWLLIFGLAAIVIATLWRRAEGNGPDRLPPAEVTVPSDTFEWTDRLDQPPAFDLHRDSPDRHPYGPNVHPEHVDENAVSLANVLKLNTEGDFECVIGVWNQLPMEADSVVWKHVGMAAAYLKVSDLDRAERHLKLASTLEQDNAVVEYFLGKLMRARSRQVPFWYEHNDRKPYRFAIYPQTPDEDDSKQRSYLPRFLGEQYAAKAKRHFRRAIELANRVDLDTPIVVAADADPIRFTAVIMQDRGVITVRDLLRSLGEADFIQKAQREIGIRVA